MTNLERRSSSALFILPYSNWDVDGRALRTNMFSLAHGFGRDQDTNNKNTSTLTTSQVELKIARVSLECDKATIILRQRQRNKLVTDDD